MIKKCLRKDYELKNRQASIQLAQVESDSTTPKLSWGPIQVRRGGSTKSPCSTRFGVPPVATVGWKEEEKEGEKKTQMLMLNN